MKIKVTRKEFDKIKCTLEDNDEYQKNIDKAQDKYDNEILDLTQEFDIAKDNLRIYNDEYKNIILEKHIQKYIKKLARYEII